MPITHIGPVDLQDPRLWLALALLAAAFLVWDHRTAPLQFLSSILDRRMHHEDLILWLMLFMLYCLWKMVR